MSEMQNGLNAMAMSQLLYRLQQGPGLTGLTSYNAAVAGYPWINAQAELLAKQHLALQQQQAAAAMNTMAESQKKTRTRITNEQFKILRAHFDLNNSPEERQILLIAAQSGLPPKVIKHWFRNTLFKERQRNKDSPYNFNNPPNTTLNLEEHEKTDEAEGNPLNSSVSDGSSSEDKSSNEHASPPPSMSNASTSQQLQQQQQQPAEQGASEQAQRQQQQSQHQEEQQHHSPSSSGVQQSQPYSSALNMSSVFSGIHHDVSSHAPSTIPTTSILLQPKPTLQNITNLTPDTYGVVLNTIATMTLAPPHVSLGSGHQLTDYSFIDNSNGNNSSINHTGFTEYQIKVLQEFFKNNAYPKDSDLEYLSKVLSLSPHVIVVWFQNARQNVRKVHKSPPELATPVFLHHVNTQQEQKQHPYVTAIGEAMKKVPGEQKLACFMSVMQVISTFT
ncbi:PREDICTED: zinc finger protein 2-like isoform X2 [Dinoponera quadriceps]|nr:PREDICTED: zinc finger protein 2-like isoform X2 [Dinoponera quadriceps]